MEQYILYLILKEIASQQDGTFKYSFNDMNSNRDNVVGIYIKGAEPGLYRSLENGKYYGVVNRVQFLLQGGLDEDSLMRCLQLGSKIRDALITASNREYIAPDKIWIDADGDLVLGEGNDELQRVKVVFSKVDLLGDLVSIGKSEQGRPRYSLNIKINYSVGGK